MLCQAYRQYVPSFMLANTELYKESHMNHPCTRWVAASPKHYAWLTKHAAAMFEEYTRRFGRKHKSEVMFDRVKEVPYALTYRHHVENFFEPPLVMPDQYKVPGKAVESYRRYYIAEKLRFESEAGRVSFARWTLGEPPYWCAQEAERVRNAYASEQLLRKAREAKAGKRRSKAGAV